MITQPAEILPAALSVPAAAAYLGISRATLYRIAAECGTGNSGLQVVRIRGRRLFMRRDLDAYLARHRVPATNRAP
jgi:excisionase family DNA binding protein